MNSKPKQLYRPVTVGERTLDPGNELLVLYSQTPTVTDCLSLNSTE